MDRMAQSRQSKPFGVACAACFEELAGVFASSGASPHQISISTSSTQLPEQPMGTGTQQAEQPLGIPAQPAEKRWPTDSPALVPDLSNDHE